MDRAAERVILDRPARRPATTTRSPARRARRGRQRPVSAGWSTRSTARSTTSTACRSYAVSIAAEVAGRGCLRRRPRRRARDRVRRHSRWRRRRGPASPSGARRRPTGASRWWPPASATTSRSGRRRRRRLAQRPAGDARHQAVRLGRARPVCGRLRRGRRLLRGGHAPVGLGSRRAHRAGGRRRVDGLHGRPPGGRTTLAADPQLFQALHDLLVASGADELPVAGDGRTSSG